MISFPNSKINLGLQIVSKRSDGYHLIESVFYPINLNDALEIIPLPDEKPGSCFFTSSGLEIPGNSANNLCVKAFDLLNEIKALPAVKIHLHKIIPMGAGLGGGSADGSFTLKLLNSLLELNLSNEILTGLAGQLGSDCSFFVENMPAEVRGTGNEISASTIDLKGYTLIIVNPDIHISTAEAYKNCKISNQNGDLFNLLKEEPLENWKQFLKNDFEEYAFKKHPEIEQIKAQLYNSGAVYSSMTGSGSAVYGLFKEDISPIDLFENQEVFKIAL